MEYSELEKELLKQVKGMPEEELQEVINFTQYIRLKKSDRPKDDLTVELSGLSKSQTEHLEAEFRDYKKKYPIE